MKRLTYATATKRFRSKLVYSLTVRGIDESDASDIVQDAFERALTTHSYKNVAHDVIDERLFRYMFQAVTWEMQMYKRKQRLEETRMHLLEQEHDEAEPSVNFSAYYEDVPELCPFCHTGWLNQYLACADCHTIVAQGKVIRYERMDDEDLYSTIDLELSADVSKALATLSDNERKITKHVMEGFSSLEDLAEFYGVHSCTIDRTWRKAKEKLQNALFQYA